CVLILQKLVLFIHMKNEIEKVRHSLAHLLAAVVLELYPDAKPTIGPVIDNGFYYDFDFASPISENDLEKIENKMREILKTWKKFEGKDVGAEEAKKFFQNNEYKLELIEGLEKENQKITFYTSGNFTDLCVGGHVDDVSRVPLDSWRLERIAGAYWRGDEKNKMLTRIYGLAFESKEELDEYLHMKEEAERRDHKKLGKELGLLMFHETAPGMPYWLPKGLIIYKELEEYWRKEHRKMNYQEIMSPLINKAELWKISGHWDHYKEDMFIADMGENEVYGIKPMNCPNAMLVFKSMQISYKDLPFRLSDTDRLHRYERSGTLNGLLRCRSFQQDDSHNFISEDMIASEYEHIMEVCKDFYGIFNLEYKFRLGTRPESYLGEVETWNKAEKALKTILEKSGKEFSIAEGDGAFYGPKIDIIMKDSLGRDWQMGTMQLDFQLPKRFDIEYTDKDGKKKTPIVIHRVIYGSLERFMGILIEHYAGNFPLWLSPVQVKVIPVRESHNAYAQEVCDLLKENNIRAEVDLADENLGKKVRQAKNEKIPYWIVLGDKEVESKEVTIESRGKDGEGQKIGSMTTQKFLELLQKEIREKK
ncbi:MAG: threonine--tRNA ligase, partial [Patescibacteria group bacterium]